MGCPSRDKKLDFFSKEKIKKRENCIFGGDLNLEFCCCCFFILFLKLTR